MGGGEAGGEEGEEIMHQGARKYQVPRIEDYAFE